MLPGDLWDRTRRAADLTGTKPTKLVRDAIEHALHELDADPSASLLSRALSNLRTAVSLIEQELSRGDGASAPEASSLARPEEP